MVGKIVRIKDKGFGFIAPETGGEDLFFHLSSLRDIRFNDLREGDLVSFEVGDGRKGPVATDIRRA